MKTLDDVIREDRGFDVVGEQPDPLTKFEQDFRAARGTSDAVAMPQGYHIDHPAIEEVIDRVLHEEQETPAGIGDVNSDKPGSGARYNSGKMPIELVPIEVIRDYEVRQFEAYPPEACNEALDVLHHLARWQRGETTANAALAVMDDPWMDASAVFDYGRKKYAEWNWAKGMPWMVPAACAVRHALAILRGEEHDAESGLPHRGHMACNLVMLCQYELTYQQGDNRPKILMSADNAPE